MPQPTTNNLERKKKLNKYGCHPSGDVCLEHDCPLISFGFCEESTDIKQFISSLRKHDMEELIKMLPDGILDEDGSGNKLINKIEQLIKDYYNK